MDVGGKRCLPPWMLKRSACEELRESANGESQLLFQGEAQIQASLQKMKATHMEVGEEFGRQKAKKLDENPGSLFLSETRKRSRRSSSLDVNPRTTSHGKSGLGRKKAPDINSASNRSAIRERFCYKKLKQTINESGPENDVDTGALFQTKNEDDVGLTVEDLVCIAEEYVNADKEKQLPQNAVKESKSEAHASSSSVYSSNNFGALCGATQSGPQISKCSATDMVDSAPVSVTRTGDVAQDMLDVFLGPLLRIPRGRKET